MEHGAVVITNLDEDSPTYLRHFDNVIDLNRCSELPTDADVLRRIGERARETAAEVSWDRLVERIGARRQPHVRDAGASSPRAAGRVAVQAALAAAGLARRGSR